MTARVISELFLKVDTFAWVTVFSEFCLQPATAVNVFECPSTSFIDEKVVEQSIKISAVRLVLQHRLPQRLFYKATISDPHRNVFQHKWCSFRRFFSFSRRHRYQRHVGTRRYRPKFRELKAIYFVLLSYVARLKHKRVKIFTDNQGAARIVAIGSSKINLQALAMDIFNLCFFNSIVLEAQWIPRSLNERADLLSGFVDKDDWSVNPSVFRVIDANGALTQSIALRRITILNSPPPAAAALTPWPRIGETRTIGSAHRPF